MLEVRQRAPKGRWVARPLVSDDYPRRVVPPSHHPSYAGFGRALIAPALHQDVDDEAVLINCAPQPVPSAVDLQRYFVQMQLVARPATMPPQLLGEHWTELAHPLA